MHNVKIIENCNSITDLEALTTFLTQGQTENDRLLYMIAEKRLKTVEYHEKVNAQVRAIIKPQEEQETTAVPTPARHPLQPHSTPTPGSLHPMNTTTAWSFSIFTPANAKGLGATGGISDQHKSMGALTAISRPAPAHNHDLDREERKELLELIEKLKKKVDERCKEKGIDDITRIARQRRKHEIHSIFADPEAKLSIEGIVDRTRRIDRLAHNSFLQGKELVARHYYTLAIRCIPKDCLDQIEIAKVLSDIHSQRAYLYLKKQEYELSLSDCNRAIQLNPDSRKPYDIKSSALLALGRDSEHLLHLRDYHKLKGVKTREELSSCLNELDLGSSGDASGNMSDREDRTGLPETTAHTSTDDGNNKVLRSARIGLSAFSLYERPSKLLKPTI
jgi:tetratricopeptide (TPR) repeat protein